MPFNILHDLLGKLCFFIVVSLSFWSVLYEFEEGKNGKKMLGRRSLRCALFFVTSDHIKQIRGMHNNVTQRLSLSPSPCLAINSVDGLIYVHVNHEKWFIGFCIWSFRCGFLFSFYALHWRAHNSQSIRETDDWKPQKVTFFPNTQHIMNDDVYNSRVEIEWGKQHTADKKDEFSASNGSSSMRSRWSSQAWRLQQKSISDSECLNRYWWADLPAHFFMCELLAVCCTTTHNIVVEKLHTQRRKMLTKVLFVANARNNILTKHIKILYTLR